MRGLAADVLEREGGVESNRVVFVPGEALPFVPGAQSQNVGIATNYDHDKAVLPHVRNRASK